MKYEIEQNPQAIDSILTLLLSQKEIVQKIDEIKQSKAYLLMNIQSLREENTLLKSQLALVKKISRI